MYTKLNLVSLVFFTGVAICCVEALQFLVVQINNDNKNKNNKINNNNNTV